MNRAVRSVSGHEELSQTELDLAPSGAHEVVPEAAAPVGAPAIASPGLAAQQLDCTSKQCVANRYHGKPNARRRHHEHCAPEPVDVSVRAGATQHALQE